MTAKIPFRIRCDQWIMENLYMILSGESRNLQFYLFCLLDILFFTKMRKRVIHQNRVSIVISGKNNLAIMVTGSYQLPIYEISLRQMSITGELTGFRTDFLL